MTRRRRKRYISVLKRYSMREVGMLQTYVQIVSNPVIWASQPSLSAAWMALLRTKAGDVESNPGSTTHTNKHTPVIWICDLCHNQIKKPQSDVTTYKHTMGSSGLLRDKTSTIQIILEMHHSHTHTHRNNNTKHRQHNNPLQTNHHPTTHRQQSTKGQKHRHTSNQHQRHQKQN